VNTLRARVRRLELDLALAAPDVGDPHLYRVAEAVPAAPAAADQGGSELVQLEVVPGKPSHRDVALEDVAEADEEARRDQARDLALEDRLPAELEQALLEQPREAELIGAVLQTGRVSLPLRRVLGVGVEVLGQRPSETPSSRSSARCTTRSG